MSGVIYHHNREQRTKSLERMTKYSERIEGKQALLQTWEKVSELSADDAQYILELKVRIRKSRVLLSHIRP